MILSRYMELELEDKVTSFQVVRSDVQHEVIESRFTVDFKFPADWGNFNTKDCPSRTTCFPEVEWKVKIYQKGPQSLAKVAAQKAATTTANTKVTVDVPDVTPNEPEVEYIEKPSASSSTENQPPSKQSDGDTAAANGSTKPGESDNTETMQGRAPPGPEVGDQIMTKNDTLRFSSKASYATVVQKVYEKWGSETESPNFLALHFAVPQFTINVMRKIGKKTGTLEKRVEKGLVYRTTRCVHSLNVVSDHR